MLHKLQQRKQDQKGFTIIEVLIVLAIAGLILLIVFLAVPALQRASRNTNRKNDVAAIASAISNFVDNNGGQMPDAVNANGGSGSVQIGMLAADNNPNFETAKTGYYHWPTTGLATAGGGSATPIFSSSVPSSGKSTNGNSAITIKSFSSGMTAPAAVAVGSETGDGVSTESVLIITGVKCNSNNNNITGETSSDNSPRSAVVLYVTESGSGNGSLQCNEAV